MRGNKDILKRVGKTSGGFSLLGFVAPLLVAFSGFCGQSNQLLEESLGSGENDIPLPGLSTQSRLREISIKIKDVAGTVQQGQRLSVRLALTNQGQVSLEGSFLVSFYAATSEEEFQSGGEIWLYTTRVDGSNLGPGETLNLVEEITLSGQFPPGDWSLFVFADPSNEIQEVEEEDNLQGPWPFSVEEATKRPDLAYIGFEALDSAAGGEQYPQLKAGSNSAGLRLNIQNTGQAILNKEYYHAELVLVPLTQANGADIEQLLDWRAAGNYCSKPGALESAIDAGLANNWSIPNDFTAAPGELFSLSVYPDLRDYPDLAPGNYLLFVHLDSENAIAESDDQNNCSFINADEIVTIAP